MSKIKSGLAAMLLMSAITVYADAPTPESTGAYLDDAAVTAKVKAALVEDKAVSAAHISVTTDKGTVKLSGLVDNQAEIDRAAQLASQVQGVKAVRNNIALKPAGRDFER